MITFFEGLPRSGKSYSAVKDYIVPLLKKGREIFGYIEGLNHAKIAELVGITEEQCRELLIPLTADQVPTIYQHVRKDAFVILDEAQDFFPLSWKPSPEMTKFITQHGHLGLDILLMGQSVKDVHNLWRRRVETLFYYEKRSGLGKSSSYKVISHRTTRSGNDVKFTPVKTDKHDYDPAYFGTYKSHADGTENKETMVDERTVIWNHPFFKRWAMPICIGGVLAIAYLVWGFKGGFAQSFSGNKPPVATATEKPAKISPAPKPEVKPQTGEPKEEQLAKPSDPLPLNPLDPVLSLSQQHRLRYTGMARVGSVTQILVEWRGTDDQLIQAMGSNELTALGWAVFINATGTMVFLQKDDKRLVAMNWLLRDRFGEVPQETNRQIAGRSNTRYYVDDYGNSRPMVRDRRLEGSNGMTYSANTGSPAWELKEPVLPADNRPQQTAQAVPQPI